MALFPLKLKAKTWVSHCLFMPHLYSMTFIAFLLVLIQTTQVCDQ